jgi:hypothetical protein
LVLVLMETRRRSVCELCFDAVVESDVSYFSEIGHRLMSKNQDPGRN